MKKIYFMLLACLWPWVTMAATPGDVLVSVQALAKDLQDIRTKVGGKANSQKELPVMGASPREVFYQAENLEAKVVDLVKQRANQEGRPLLLIPKGKITPDHVLAVMESARTILGKGKQAMGAGSPVVKSAAGKASPTDVYRSLIQANRQINLLLTTKIIPSDVYQRVEQSVQIAQVLNTVYGGSVELSLPPLDLKKGPGHVYDQMVICFRLIREILLLTKVKTMDLAADYKAAPGTSPGDVFDLASLLYSEMAHLYFALPNRPLTAGVFYVGKKKPGHVYQLAKGFETQLRQLKVHVTKNPAKLTH
ncbi:hypothetical protein [Magnetococcus sp. PR-3]|uniref:hypothetical protein n=1 Tax=Magnetococcus sp. PR-3 TaxID=3120355 RepID=UPI002FCE2DFE